jgi:biopolymer transport protein TolR
MPLKKARLRISDYNQNRKTRLRSQERKTRVATLSLTSMVDMFAILVIFLLTNSSTVTQWIEVSHGIELPRASKAEQQQKAATIQISKEGVFVEGKMIIALAQVVQGPATVETVRTWLKSMPKEKGAKEDSYVNVVAHERVPFGVIKKIVATCQDSGFGKVNLAVQPLN